LLPIHPRQRLLRKLQAHVLLLPPYLALIFLRPEEGV
jgi:hypothetical protein